MAPKQTMVTIYPSVVKVSSAPDLDSMTHILHPIKPHPIIIISSKPLSKRSYDVLHDAGKLKEFIYEKYYTWDISHLITFGNPDFVFFDIINPDVLGYIQNNFTELPKEKLIILKHSHENIHEDWINVIRLKVPNILVITHT